MPKPTDEPSRKARPTAPATLRRRCPSCASEHVIRRGKDRLQCFDCRKYFQGDGAEVRQFQETGLTGEVTVVTERRVKTLQDLIEVCQIDTEEWEIERWVANKWEVGRKDKQVNWSASAMKNTVVDSGKIFVEPLFQVKVFLRRKIKEKTAREAVDIMVKAAKKHAPRYAKIKYPKIKAGVLYEIGMPDLQLGRLVMAEEAGKESSPDLYVERVRLAISQLLAAVSVYQIERIVFPLGHDFFDSNTAAMMTAHGTPQKDDVRWQRTFRLGTALMVEIIDMLARIAPVDVLMIPGNHDEERLFYLGEYLDAWYSKGPNVKVDNSASKRKYYRYGRNLLGLTHGYHEKLESLAGLMSYEVPQWWSASTNREFHIGDKHHKKDLLYKTNEMENGVVIRLLRSLASPSVWEYDKGLVGSLKSAEGFIWHPEAGVIAQFTASPDRLAVV